MIRFIINILLVLWLGLLTAATIESHRTVDWSNVKGMTATQGKEAPLDLLGRMELVSVPWRRTAATEITEAEVNRYLARIVAGRQAGPTATTANFQRVALDFEPGQCRIIFLWDVAGRGSTSASLEFTVRREGENFVVEPRQGTYGRLPVFRGMMCALMPALESLCDALDDEIHAVFQMNKIRFEKDKVILDPRSEAGK